MYLLTLCTLLNIKILSFGTKYGTLWLLAIHFAFSTMRLSALQQQHFKPLVSATTAKTLKQVNLNGIKLSACTCGNLKQQLHALICSASGTIKFTCGLNITFKNVCQLLDPVLLLGSTMWS